MLLSPPRLQFKSLPFIALCLLDDGKLHKAINANDKMHIIEEMTLFPEPQPVQHIELDPQRVNHFSDYCLAYLCQVFTECIPISYSNSDRSSKYVKETHLAETQPAADSFLLLLQQPPYRAFL